MPDSVSENCLPFPPESALLARLVVILREALPQILGYDPAVLRGDEPAELGPEGGCVVWIDGKSEPEYSAANSRHFWTLPVRIEIRVDRGDLHDPAARARAGQLLALVLFGDILPPDPEATRAIDRLSGPGIRVRHIADQDVEDWPKSDEWLAVIRLAFTVHASALAE